MKQLKGFEKITLKPGETQTVSFPIDIEALKFWNQQMKYDAEPGPFTTQPIIETSIGVMISSRRYFPEV